MLGFFFERNPKHSADIRWRTFPARIGLKTIPFFRIKTFSARRRNKNFRRFTNFAIFIYPNFSRGRPSTGQILSANFVCCRRSWWLKKWDQIINNETSERVVVICGRWALVHCSLHVKSSRKVFMSRNSLRNSLRKSWRKSWRNSWRNSWKIHEEIR